MEVDNRYRTKLKHTNIDWRQEWNVSRESKSTHSIYDYCNVEYFIY